MSAVGRPLPPDLSAAQEKATQAPDEEDNNIIITKAATDIT